MALSRGTLVWLLLALALTAVTVTAVVWRAMAKPTELTVAVARDTDDAALVEAFARVLDATNASVRLRPLLVDDVIIAGERLAAKKAHLAVARPDLSELGDALGVTPLHKSALFLASVGEKGEADLAKLAGKRIAIVVRAPGDRALVDRVLSRYDMGTATKIQEVSTGEAMRLVSSRQVEAVAFVAAPLGRDARRIFRDLAGRSGAALTLLDVDEADLIAEIAPVLAEETVKAGALQARPKAPADDLTTISASYYLMAQRDVNRETVATLTELLFKERQKIARAAPIINQMKGLDPDEAPKSTIPTHPGAIDYFAREQRSFLDLYGDWLWLGLFAAGGVSSAVTALWSFLSRQRRNAVHDILDRLGVMLKQARTAEGPRLEELELQLDDVVRDVIRHTTEERTSTRTMSALMLAIESTRAAVGERLALIRK